MTASGADARRAAGGGRTNGHGALARMRALVDAVRLVNANAHDLDATLDALAEQARRLLGADGTGLYFAEADGSLVVRRRPDDLVRPDPPMPEGTRVGPAGLGLTREAISTRAPVFAPCFQEDARVAPELRARAGQVASVLAVPLFAGDELQGMLHLAWRQRPRVNAADVELAGALGTHAAFAIRNARLLERTGRAGDRAARAQAILAPLAAAGTRQEVVAAVLRDGLTAVGATSGAVLFPAEDGTALEVAGEAGDHSAKAFPVELKERWRRIPLTAPLPIVDAFRSGEAVFLESPSEILARYPALAHAPTEAMEARASIPLVLAGRPIGVLVLGFHKARQFDEEERSWLVALGGRCALALERARLHDELTRSEERYRLVVESVPAAVWEMDDSTNQVVWSGSGTGLFGYLPSEGARTSAWWIERIHPDDRERVVAEGRAARQAGADRWGHELRFQRADGTYAQVVILTRTRRDEAGTLVGSLGMITDVTAERAAEAERDRLVEALARAEERERVAMDLHDDLVQQLYGAVLVLAGARLDAEGDPATAPAALAKAGAALQATVESVRGYMGSLRSPAAAAGGFGAGLRAIVAEFQGSAETRIELSAGGEIDALVPPDAAGDVLLVAREAVSNAVRHGGASRIVLRAARDGDRLVLTVEDDGAGFESDAAGPAAGFGLRNMAARARRLGGDFALETAPGRGTTVRLDLPLPRPAST